MSDNQFFKPTVLYKEYMILDMIEKNPNITQREMAKTIGIAVSMINDYLEEYENEGYIKRKYISTKTVEYFITKKGLERRKLLNIWYLKSSHMVYSSAKDNIVSFLNQIIEKGFKRILLYGAGEVAEIMLRVIDDDNDSRLCVLAVVDDDISKIDSIFHKKKSISVNSIKNYQVDGVLISSYKHLDKIYESLKKVKYDESKIIKFFEDKKRGEIL